MLLLMSRKLNCSAWINISIHMPGWLHSSGLVSLPHRMASSLIILSTNIHALPLQKQISIITLPPHTCLAGYLSSGLQQHWTWKIYWKSSFSCMRHLYLHYFHYWETCSLLKLCYLYIYETRETYIYIIFYLINACIIHLFTYTAIILVTATLYFHCMMKQCSQTTLKWFMSRATHYFHFHYHLERGDTCHIYIYLWKLLYNTLHLYQNGRLLSYQLHLFSVK